jgi:peptide/nickel transport system ATP-binding protein
VKRNRLNSILQIERLTISHAAPASRFIAVRDLSIEIARGETVALVGESGCGKTTLALAIPGLLGTGARRESGRILFEAHDTAFFNPAEWRRVRGRGIGMVFQDPRSALNPVLSVGAHLLETLRAHKQTKGVDAKRHAEQTLEEVGMAEPAAVMKRFPSELSGGMCQRIGIALAILNDPGLLIADEPTSALDPTVGCRILDLLHELKTRRGMALLMISHDLALVSRYADRVLMMYHGRIIESGLQSEVLESPMHPYTRALLQSRPGERTWLLPVIPGAPPSPGQELPGCAFAPRCGAARPFCTQSTPAPHRLSESHSAACVRIGEIPPNLPG